MNIHTGKKHNKLENGFFTLQEKNIFNNTGISSYYQRKAIAKVSTKR